MPTYYEFVEIKEASDGYFMSIAVGNVNKQRNGARWNTPEDMYVCVQLFAR